MKTKLDKYFRISQRGSTIGTELIGGATTFATMAYILAYMTGAMSAVPGIDLTGVLLCTALITAISCIAMGWSPTRPSHWRLFLLSRTWWPGWWPAARLLTARRLARWQFPASSFC